MDEPSDSIIAAPSSVGDETTTIAAPFDPTLLTEYLTELATVLLDATRYDLQVSLLTYPDTLQRCSKFATDPNAAVLYLRKESADGDSHPGTFTLISSD
jgi:dynein heavy chain 1, cytosolic